MPELDKEDAARLMHATHNGFPSIDLIFAEDARCVWVPAGYRSHDLTDRMSCLLKALDKACQL